MPITVLALAFLGLSATFQSPRRVRLFERVVRVLSEHLYDAGGARAVLEARARELRVRLAPDTGLAAQHALVQELLEGLGLSHLALISEAAHQAMEAELREEPRPTLGFQLVAEAGRFFADWIYEGGPAERAGILRGEEVVAIDGIPPAASARLDWRTDDAALPDPPLHALLCAEGEYVEFVVDDGVGGRRTLSILAREYCGADATRSSARIVELGRFRFGYVHFWFMSSSTPSTFLRELVDGPFASCDALLLDLRGRGGYPTEVERVLRVLDAEQNGWSKPVVALIHAGTRSAKEVLAWRLRSSERALLVGEATAGAVIPASFAPVGDGAILMFPAATLGEMTERIEARGVQPDVPVEAAFIHSHGDDPIFSAAVVAARVWCEARTSIH